MTGGDGIVYRRLRAPHEHGATLIDPPLNRCAETLAENRRLLSGLKIDVAGRSLRELSAQARTDLVSLAFEHTRRYSNLGAAPPNVASAPLLVAGHQPQLFHPGVWFKNFVLSSLGRAHSAIAVNVLVDNDTQRGAALRVPTGDVAHPRTESVAFDRAADEMPYEERALLDAATFESFGRRAASTIRPLVAQPLVETWWPRAVSAISETRNLGRAFSQSRHQLERDWGLETLEVPLSTLCGTRAFRWFACHLLIESARLAEVYNEALAEYRRVHRIRSRSHPVPGLASDGEWREAPFWIWTREAPRRRRVFVRRSAAGLEVTDRAGLLLPLVWPTSGDAERAVEQMGSWAASGIRFRPRALMTTLYLRLVSSDLFLHGIGGAKYDQLTDALMRRFFGVEPPRFVTLTATAQLPIEHPRTTWDDVRTIKQRLRALRFHPERYLAAEIAESRDDETQLAAWIAEKLRWLELDPPRGQRLTRHRAIGALNESLQTHVEGLRARWTAELSIAESAARRHELLASREYSFCLFPADELRALLLELSRCDS